MLMAGACYTAKICNFFEKPTTYIPARGMTFKNKIGGRIRDWPIDERPRERLIRRGPESLSDAHLLAILLRTGSVGRTAVETAHQLLRRFGGLSSLTHLGISELCSMNGIGRAKAAEIMASIELGRRALAHPLSSDLRVLSSRDVYDHYYPLMRELKKEVFMMLMFDSKNRLLKETQVSTGSLSLNIVHPREVFRPAVRESAAAVILLHNHPSGDPTPSPEDQELTSRMFRAGEIMGIKVLDHIVMGDGKYYSFADHGLQAQV